MWPWRVRNKQMRALALDYQSRQLGYLDVPEPAEPGSGEVLLETIEVGVCGTDRDLAKFRFGKPPAGRHHLILGHEALARVKAVGSQVTGCAPGDLVVPRVRHSCRPACSSCSAGRSDLCVTNNYHERGITGLDGFFRPFAVDDATHLHAIPSELAEVAVLVEPMSVVEKAYELAIKLHASGQVRRLAVIGAGTIGLLTAMLAKLKGHEVTVVSREAVESPRAKLIQKLGCSYQVNFSNLSADVIIEAAGSNAAACSAISGLAPLGVLILLGAPDGIGDMPFLRMIVGNQVVAGSVNAAPNHFALAVKDLSVLDRSMLGNLIERRNFASAKETIISGAPESIKLVHRLD